ncbi:uncharacterized protein LOC123546894 isoform X2 [Mercenaria mercenaria]|uniref:uncharacterized protein LOC123546894 isoform X2 n=1 Tax=Mercenaria mercenaria TaxID=6596 RepID=UPI00234FA308|nr:uncharacterized protein LOC123546894 isoform X2 [Mercenaria mercenaria]
MNIFVSINLVLSAFISVCLTARLTDDQLAQILTDKLSASPMTDSREYPLLDDINELDRRFAALEKFDDVTDRLFDDETQEEYGDGPNIGSDSIIVKDDVTKKNLLIENKFDDDVIRKVLPIKDEFDDALTDLTDTVNELDGSFLNVKDVQFGGTIEGRHEFQNSFNVCSQRSYTLEAFEDCLREENVKNKENALYQKTEKLKRNPFCGRFGCRNRYTRRQLCKGPKCSRRTRKAKEAAEMIFIKKYPVKKFACNRGRCSNGKRSIMAENLNDVLDKMSKRYALEKKTVGRQSTVLRLPSDLSASSQTNTIKEREESGTLAKLTEKA